MTRGKALLIVAPMALIVIALLLLPLLLDKQRILELATAMIAERTGATLSVGGDIELQVFPRIGVSLDQVALALPDEAVPGLQVRSLQLGLQLLPLFSGEVAVDRLYLDGLTYRVAASPQGEKVDTGTMTDEQLDAYYSERRRQQAEAGSPGAVLAVPLALNVKTLEVTDSRLELEQADGAEPTIVEIRDFRARDLNLGGQPIGLAADLRLPREPPLQLDLEATLRLDQARQLLLLDSLQLQVAGSSPDKVELQASGEVELERQAADLELAVSIGATRGEGRLRYAALESPVIDADMHFNRFDPAILALAGPGAAAGGDTDIAEDGDSGDQPLPLAALRAIDTRARLTIDEAIVSGHRVEALEASLRALDGVIEVPSLSGQVYGGQLTAQGTLNGRYNSATLTTSGELRQVDIAAALAGAEAKPFATGRAGLDWELQGEGRTRNELVNALSGPVTLQTSGVVLQGISVQGLLCEVVALANQETLSASFEPDTRFASLGASIRLADGRAQLQPLRAELEHIALTGRGYYTLLAGDFDTTFEARLSPGLESLDPACRVSKRLTAIDWPVDCSGNIKQPPAHWCKVDAAEILKDLSVNEAQRKIEKKAGKLLEKLFN